MAKTKIFWDMEFTGLHKLTTAISIGLVAEDGKKYYAEFTDFDKYQIDDFLRKEVLSKRILGEYNPETDYDPKADTVYVKGDSDDVYATMLAWLEQYAEDGIEMWGDLLAYDWVLFINIFGNGLALPKFIDYIPMDLCTALALYGEDKDVNRDVFAYGEELAETKKAKKHNSLYDAETSLEVFKKLLAKVKPPEEESGEESEEAVEVEENETVAEYKEEADEVLSQSENGEEDNPPMAKLLSEEEKEEEKVEAPIKTVVKKEVEKKSTTNKQKGRPPKNTSGEKKK